MMNNPYLLNDARAWLKRKNSPDEVLRVILDMENDDSLLCYLLYKAYDEVPEYYGRILFDAKGYWIYDGAVLSISEQEQIAKFIINYAENV